MKFKAKDIVNMENGTTLQRWTTRIADLVTEILLLLTKSYLLAFSAAARALAKSLAFRLAEIPCFFVPSMVYEDMDAAAEQ
jgi:hypothetical protein